MGDLLSPETQAETRGMSIMGMLMPMVVIARLREKNVLTDSEIQEMLDGVLTMLETSFPGDDASVQAARELLEQLGNIVIPTAKPGQ